MSSNNIQDQLEGDSLEESQNLLSEYNIKQIIGRGTFSIVKLGEHKLTKEKVAIKIMQKNKILNQEDLIRIEREIQMLKCLNHVNVIKIYNILEDSKRFYIIMEYCENGELFNRIVDKKRLSEDESAIFYYQLINGLEYIHKNNIVHRDLKPENLLLSKDDILKIIDFGLSNYSKYNILLGTPCGSPCYASPEMVSGQKYNGFLIDIWSSGIILFAMICGYLPFEDNNNELLFGKILKCKINYPKHIGKLPLDLMKKIIVPDPNKRITLPQIKEHPFFLKGKSLFNQKYLNLNNEDKNKNINPIKCQIIKNRVKKEFNLNNVLNNYYAPKKEYDFAEYKPCFSENNDPLFDDINNRIYIKNITGEKKIMNNDINILNTKSYDFCEIGKFIKENKDENKRKKHIINNSENKIKHFKSILNTTHVPRFCNSKDNKNHQNSLYMKPDLNIKIKKPKEEEKYEMPKEDINTMHLTNISGFKNIFKNIINIHNPRNDSSENSPKFTKDLKREFIFRRNKLKTEANKTKSPENNKKNYNYFFPYDNNRTTEKIIEEYNPIGKKNYFENHSAYNQRIELKYKNRKSNVIRKPKYSFIKEKEFKNFYDNSQNDSNLELINKMKLNSNSNSVPKNNDKNNYYIEETFPNNIYTKINYKNIKKIEKNHNVFNTNNFKVNYNKESNKTSDNYKIKSRLNKYVYDKYLNNTISQEKTNKDKIYDISTEFQLIQKNKNKTIDQNKNNIINHSNKVTRLYQSNNLDYQSFENQIIGLSKKNTNVIPSNRKDILHLNKYDYDLNSKRIIKTKTKNNIKNLGDLKKSVEVNHKINNDKFINNENINKFNINKNEKYKNGNSNSFKGIRTINNKCFENVIINNNNSINIHEPKLYIYLENNNSNSNAITNSKNNYENLKTFNNQTQKSKLIFKDEKNNDNDFPRYTNRKSINTIIEHTQNILNRKKKKIKTNILDIKNIKKNKKLYDNTRYENDNDIYEINKNNRSTNVINDLVKFNNESITENNEKYNLVDIMKNNNNNNNIYNLTEVNNKENYLYKSNDTLFKIPRKYKEKKIKYSHKSTNTINNYLEKENNMNDKSFKNALKISKRYAGKSDYSLKNLHNFTKTDVNMDIFDYDKNKIPNFENIMINHYFINNKHPKTLRSKKYNFINNSNYLKYKEKSPMSLDNITNEDYNNFIKMNNNNYEINNNNTLKNGRSENYKYIMPINHNVPFIKYRKLNTIVTDRTHTPLVDKNYPNNLDPKFLDK